MILLLSTVFTVFIMDVNGQPVKSLIQRGETFELWKNQDGSYTWNNAPRWIESARNVFVPYIVYYTDANTKTINVNGYIQVQNGLIGARIFRDTASFYDPEMTEERVNREQWILRRERPLLKDYVPELLSYERTQISASKTSVSIINFYSSRAGDLSVSYTFKEGSAMKHDVVFVASQTGKYSLEQKWSGILADELETVSGLSRPSKTSLKVDADIFHFQYNNRVTVYEDQRNAKISLWKNTVVGYDKADLKIYTSYFFGNWTLKPSESFTVDPATSTASVSDRYDDAWETGAGVFRNDQAYSRIESNTDDSSSDYGCTGLRFQDVIIAQGMNVTNATLSAYIYTTTRDDMNAVIYGNNVDDAENFNDNQNIINSTERVRTSANKSWVENSLGGGDEDLWIYESDFQSIVHEIVNRAGWTSGNSLALLFIANTNNNLDCDFYAYDLDSSYACSLEITYDFPESVSTDGFTIKSTASITGESFDDVNTILYYSSAGTTQNVTVGSEGIPTTIEVDDVLFTSWSYDATNEIVALSGCGGATELIWGSGIGEGTEQHPETGATGEDPLTAGSSTSFPVFEAVEDIVEEVVKPDVLPRLANTGVYILIASVAGIFVFGALMRFRPRKNIRKPRGLTGRPKNKMKGKNLKRKR